MNAETALWGRHRAVAIHRRRTRASLQLSPRRDHLRESPPIGAGPCTPHRNRRCEKALPSGNRRFATLSGLCTAVFQSARRRPNAVDARSTSLATARRFTKRRPEGRGAAPVHGRRRCAANNREKPCSRSSKPCCGAKSPPRKDAHPLPPQAQARGAPLLLGALRKLRGLREVAEALGCGAKWTSLDDGRRGLLKAVRKLRASAEAVERPPEGIRIAYLPDPVKSQGAPPERYAAAVLESLREEERGRSLLR